MAAKRRITIADIAREAGVSVTTASFYINGKAAKYKIAENTCQRLEAIIRKHHFTPSIHARAIQSNKTFLIGLIIPGKVNKSFWIDIIDGIGERLCPESYHLLLSLSHHSLKEEIEAFNFMKTKGVDGYIFAPVIDDNREKNDTYINKLAEEKPVIAITKPVDAILSVYNNNYAGGRKLAEYFFEKGHRSVAYVGHPRSPYDSRGKGFMESYQSKGHQVASFAGVDQFLSAYNGFTGVFCFSDYFLLELYQKLQVMQVKIPEQLSVAGYDNMDFVRLMDPVPTTVHQHKREIGQAAAEQMLLLINGKKTTTETGNILFDPEIVAGNSVSSLSS